MSDTRRGNPDKSTVSLRETLRRLGWDRRRLQVMVDARRLATSNAILSPSFLCVFLFRLSHFFHCRGRTVTSRFLWQVNLSFTGADISPACRLGEGLLVIHPLGTTIAGSAGARLTIVGHGGLGGELGVNDIGAGPGLPLLGDDVHLARGASVLGPVRVGSDVYIGAGVTVVRDVPDGSTVPPHPIKVRLGPLVAAHHDDD